MNLPPLSECYPVTKTLAELYGGWSEGTYFKRRFIADSLEGQLQLLNAFLAEQKFNLRIEKTDIENEVDYFAGKISIYRNILSKSELMLVYEQPTRRFTIDELLSFLNKFRNDRDWKKYHTSKNLAMAVASESGELVDLFLWDRESSVETEKVEMELADILTYCIYLADNYGIDLLDAVVKKAIANDLRYPVSKSNGLDIKYDKL